MLFHCKTSRPTTKATGTRKLTLSGIMQDLEWSALNKCWNSLWIFKFSQWYIPFLSIIFGLQLRLDYLQGCIFLKEINHWLIVFSLPTFNFCKKIYSQNDEGLEIIFFFFFAVQPWWADLDNFFVLNSFSSFYNSVVTYL